MQNRCTSRVLENNGEASRCVYTKQYETAQQILYPAINPGTDGEEKKSFLHQVVATHRGEIINVVPWQNKKGG